MKTTVQLDDRQLATALAALRFWQQAMQGSQSKAFRELDEEIATDGGRFDSLSASEIDSLCEEANTSEPLHIIVEVSGGVADPVHVSHEASVTIYDHDNIGAGDEPPLDLEKETETMNTY